MRLTLDNSAWIALGQRGIERLANALRVFPDVEVWENAPTLYETAWHWGIRGRNDLARRFSRAKSSIVGDRIIPEPLIVIQRAIAQMRGARIPDGSVRQRVRDLLQQRGQIDRYGLRRSLRRRIAFTKMEFVADVQAMASTLQQELGTNRLTNRQFDLIWTHPDVRQIYSEALRQRFQVPPNLRAHVALYHQWRTFAAGRFVTQFYEDLVRSWCVTGRRCRHQDFFDLEVLICSTGVDVLVTNNVRDFQNRGLTGLSRRLMTVDQFTRSVGLA